MTLTSKDILKKIRRIQVVTKQLANDVLAGAYRSAFKGKGMEFEEVREYQPGDEIRTIDWNVTARMNHPFVKTFREERDLTVFLVVDVSGSALFGSHYIKKNILMAELGAVLAFSAIRNNDKIGVLLFSDQIEKYIPPRKGTRHVLRVIRELLLSEPQHQGSGLSNALAFLGKVQVKRSICFLISDFLCENYVQEMALIAAKHDLIAVRVTDPAEENFPDMGLVHAVDLEAMQQALIDTDLKKAREHYHKTAQAQKKQFEQHMKEIGVEYIDLQTSQPYISALKKFFKVREKKRR